MRGGVGGREMWIICGVTHKQNQFGEGLWGVVDRLDDKHPAPAIKMAPKFQAAKITKIHPLYIFKTREGSR